MRLTSLVLVLLLAGGLFWWFALRGPAGDVALTASDAAARAEAPAEAKEKNPPVEVVVIDSRAAPVTNKLTLRGRTVPNRRVEVTAETEGKVVSEPKRKGSTVAEGEVLCRLDPGIRQAQLKEAEAQLAQARIEAEAAERLSEKGFSPETTRVAREATLEAAKAQVERIELDIARLELHAPFAGVLETDAAETGARLGVGGTCATLIDLTPVKVSAFVSEREVGRIEVGQPATARLVTGETVDGEISHVARSADEDTRTFEVEVALPNDEGHIRAGMTAEIEVALPPTEAHAIPQSALTLDDEGRMGVRVAEAGTARFYPVEIVREQPDGIWVTGLPRQARVIVSGQEFVRDGRAVRAVPLDASALR